MEVDYQEPRFTDFTRADRWLTGIHQELERFAALHMQMASPLFLAKSPRLPLSRFSSQIWCGMQWVHERYFVVRKEPNTSQHFPIHANLVACGHEVMVLMDLAWTLNLLATAGFGVFGIDYVGHGKSMGSRAYIKKFEHIVTDCYQFFKSITEVEEYRDKGRFLYGESMGGAVALLLHRRNPTFWDGAVLVAPMCKISEKVKPHPLVVNLLTRVEEIIPKWKIVPAKDVIDSAFKDPIKREQIRSNRLIYQDKPRLKTALELLRTSMELESNLSTVKLPFFVLHGEADTVTDPEVSQALYECAGSADKTIKLYQGMWHGLTSGEPDDNVEAVFADIVGWLDQRSFSRAPEWAENVKEVGLDGSSSVSPAAAGPRRFLCGWKGRTQHHSAM
ncbi:hypothetical protein ZIOFF_043930 [Zingiber officinale]|uniref:Serine aminopeptidase S33 domain-containing protein n=1 Tax=Zingiber officinale TaxID=94328 RepID=A0A8J5GBC2_ZINOF|nr:hypothetical protein ZIOFF_043930 [Zingiber officinale]